MRSAILIPALFLAFVGSNIAMRSYADRHETQHPEVIPTPTATVEANGNANLETAGADNTNVGRLIKTNGPSDPDPGPPNTGIRSCDDYLLKYEACLIKIAGRAPQAGPALMSAFGAQRDAFKKAAAIPSQRANLARTCREAIFNAKKATAQWCSNW